VLEHLIGDTELLERMNPARRERKIDRTPTDNVAFARISPSLIKIYIVPAPAQIRGEQPASETAANKSESCSHSTNG
jgi:hypothetical protein